MSTISNYVYGSDWYDQYKYASNVYHRKVGNSVSATGTAENDSKQVDPLESLVDSGTITEDQENAIKSAFESAAKSTAYSRFKIQSNTENSESYDPLKTLVDNGTITEDQKTAVKDLLDNQMRSGNIQPPPPPPQENSQNSLDASLDDLVSSGTITEDQKSEVLAAIKAAFEAGTASTDTTSDTDSDTTDPLEALVNAGTITKEQESAIKSVFDKDTKSNKMPPPPPPEKDNDSFDNVLEGLVTNGTITEDQKTSILEAMNTESDSDNTDNNSTYEAYIKGLSELFNKFQTAVNAYETQFEAGQEDSVSNSDEGGILV